MFAARWLLLGVIVWTVGCDGTVDVEIETPPDGLYLEISDEHLVVPTELHDGDVLATLPCGAGLECPSLPDFALLCIEEACDPRPLELVLPVGDVIDFEQLNRELRQIAGRIERIQINFVRYRVVDNDFNVPLGPVELFWGPAQTTDLQSPGVQPLGRMMDFGEGVRDVDLNDAGNRALSEYLAHTSRQIRVFARTEVDLAPEQALPAGTFGVDLQLSITVTGRLL